MEDIIERKHEEEEQTADSEEEQEMAEEMEEEKVEVVSEDSLIPLQYKGYVTHFRHNHRLYIVIID